MGPVGVTKTMLTWRDHHPRPLSQRMWLMAPWPVTVLIHFLPNGGACQGSAAGPPPPSVVALWHTLRSS